MGPNFETSGGSNGMKESSSSSRIVEILYAHTHIYIGDSFRLRLLSITHVEQDEDYKYIQTLCL